MMHGFEAWRRDAAGTDPELADGGARLLPSAGRAVRGAGQQPRLRAGNAAYRGASTPMAPSAGPPAEVSLLRPGDSVEHVARIQVKLEGGDRVVFVMCGEQTVGELHEGLQRWRIRRGCPDDKGAEEQVASKPFSLRSAFPPKTYDHMDSTLQEAGLTPSATLFVSTETVVL